MKKLWIPLIISLSWVAILSCGKQKTEDTGAAVPQESRQPARDTVTTASGLKYFDIKVGTGPVPQPGQMVRVHYIGRFPDGVEFSSSRELNDPIKFPIGGGRVIKGLDEGVSTMPVGTIRVLIVPPELGYAEKGWGNGKIPPGATLVFEIELLEIIEPKALG